MPQAQANQSLSQEVYRFIHQYKTLHLSTVNADHQPCASYAPFALGDNCLYILISELAQHTRNLLQQQQAAILIVEDEQDAHEIFARTRLTYQVTAQLIVRDQKRWQEATAQLKARHGERIEQLCCLSDFHLFELKPTQGQFVKGFAQAFQLEAGQLISANLKHLKSSL